MRAGQQAQPGGGAVHDHIHACRSAGRVAGADGQAQVLVDFMSSVVPEGSWVSVEVSWVR